MPGTRFDRPRGRFFSDSTEVGQINRALAEYQDAWGTTVDWWFFTLDSTPLTLTGYANSYTTPYDPIGGQAAANSLFIEDYTDGYTDPDPESSVFDSLYDEGSQSTDGNGGKKFRPLYNLPVLSAHDAQGAESTDDQGLATYDRVILRLSFEQARRAGLSPGLIATRDEDLLDRFVYRSKVFDVRQITTQGHVSSQDDLVVVVTGVEIRPDELEDSSVFSRYTSTG